MDMHKLLIRFRYFWPLIPGLAAAIGGCWVFWGLGFMWSFVVPATAGVGVFLLFTWVQLAAATAAPR